MNEQKRKFLDDLKQKEADYVLMSINDLMLKQNDLIDRLNAIKGRLKNYDNYERFMMLGDIISELSYYKNDTIYEAIKSLGLGKYILPKFIDHHSLFEKLVKHQIKSKYFFPYRLVWPYFKLYSDFFIKDKLGQELNIDVLEVDKKVNRQRRNLNFPDQLKDFTESIYHFMESIKKQDPMIDFNLSKKTYVQ
ncbi:hypothetical protein [Winogradskyella sp.]|uniref:hypothetical protein n=1 Tax=Winogradskyella sp. TaxID=1883156 RepID=UPI0026387620|nr:hypothetical protein [Winogradskyella sp.]